MVTFGVGCYLKIAHLNVRGIVNKIVEIRLLLLDSKLDVLASTVT